MNKDKVNQIIADDVVYGTYNLGFNGNDETQFTANNADDLRELWREFCKENDLDSACIDYCEKVNNSRSLDISLELTSDDTFDVTVYESQSGESLTICCHDEGEFVFEENERVMREIRSWVSLMREKISD